MEDYYSQTGMDEDNPDGYVELYGAREEEGTPPSPADLPPPPRSATAISQRDAGGAQEPTSDPDEPDLDPRSEMTLWEHLEELRSTIIKSLVALIIGVVIVGFFFSQMNEAILWPLNQALEGRPDREQFLRMNTMFGVFSVIIEIAVVGGFLLALPFILYFVAQFIAPGLTKKERRILIPCCVSALGLFLFGVAFSYFLLMPAGIHVAISINESMGFFLQPNVQDYYTLVVWMLGGVGLVFEFPLLLLLLVYLELLTPQMLKKYRRHVIVAIFVIAALVTPPDVISQIIMAIPLYLLYEATILVGGRLLERKRLRQSDEASAD